MKPDNPTFPPLFCISLARAKERRAAMRRRLDSLGMPYEIIDAVDGRDLDLAKLEAEGRLRQDLCMRRYGRNMTKGEVGCYLSHYNLWQRIVAENMESSLVLEDDTEWGGDFAAVIQKLRDIPYPWDIIVLHTSPKKYGGDVVWKIDGEKYKITRAKKRIARTSAYLISSGGARKLAAYCREIQNPVDNAYGEYWRNGLAFYAVEPKIVNEVEPVSTIGENRKPDGALLARIWASLWRKRDWQRMWFLGDKNLEIDPI